MTAEPHGLMLCDDLLFTSKVTGTARAVGVIVTAIRSVERLVALAETEPPSCVILDLHNTTLDLPTLMSSLREKCPTMPRVIAFGSHVDVDLLAAARQAGCDRVMPRSQFVKQLETGLKEWLS